MVVVVAAEIVIFLAVEAVALASLLSSFFSFATTATDPAFSTTTDVVTTAAFGSS